jgi:5-methylcytosine-specific restriction enzyme A
MARSKRAKPCLERGCTRIVIGASRCAEHLAVADAKRQAYLQSYQREREETRPSRHERGYGNDWYRTSRLILIRDNHICHYCGAHATTVDHVISKAKGGSDDHTNLVAACASCNASKRDR